MKPIVIIEVEHEGIDIATFGEVDVIHYNWNISGCAMCGNSIDENRYRFCNKCASKISVVMKRLLDEFDTVYGTLL